MLVELRIENYAVIEKLHIHFHPGFNVLTGETGSGKSIVVDALSLLFGGRTSAEMLRSGADRARISGIFEAPSTVTKLLEEAGIELEEGELLIHREISSGGKSRAFICNQPATAALLRDLSTELGDIHGQHDQQRLFSPVAQLDILDEYTGAADLLARTSDLYDHWRSCTAELQELDRTEQEKLRLLDLWTFQRKEIESAGLKPGEDVELEAERRVFQNVGKLLEAATTAYTILYDAPESVMAQIRVALRKIEELVRIDSSLEATLEILKPAQIAVDEASSTLRDYLGRVETDPDRLDEVEARLAAIDKLKRKYGTNVEEILAFGDSVRAQVEAVESAAERRAEIERRRSRVAGEYESVARELSTKRRDAAMKFSKAVERELGSLAMDRTVFRVDVREASWSKSGTDSVEFLVSANAGEEPKALDRVASGGELSRIALAIKTSLTLKSKSRVSGRTLVFDEVDAGIGGVAAETVGRKLHGLAERNQVLCVTHLAQIAGFADHHYLVEKKESKGRTVAVIAELSGESRTREVGRMLSGQHLTPEALRHAEQLIRGR